METEKELEELRGKIEGLRFRKHYFVMTNQSIIEFAYCVKELIEPLIETHVKLAFEQANCYLACFYDCRRLLQTVDSEYLAEHTSLSEFYKDGRELSNDWDKLWWEEKICNCSQVETDEFPL